MNGIGAAKVTTLKRMFNHACDAMIGKVDKLLKNVIKAPSIKCLQAIVSMCPSNLQTPKMVSTAEVSASIPLVNPKRENAF